MDEKTNELNEKLKYTKETLSNTKETLSIETTRKVNSGDENISYKGEKTIDELHDNVKYYCEKINVLEKRTAGAKAWSSSKYFYVMLLCISIIMLTILLFRVGTDLTEERNLLVDAVGVLYLPFVLLVITRAYNVYLAADQMKYDCRDKLFENLEQLKCKGKMDEEEKKLYDILVSEKLEIPEWLQKKETKKKQ